jgi:hypothetical protein
LDAFEQIVARVFDREGYWIKQSFKVNLTADEKRRIGTPSMPRPEIDLLAFRPGENLVHVIECKSYLDNPGVTVKSFQNGVAQERFKIFNDENRRRIIFDALRRQLIEQMICAEGVNLRLGLVTGKIKQNERLTLRQFFDEKDWDLWDDEWVADKLKEFSANLYEDSIVDMTVKIISRHMGSGRSE